MIPVLHLSKINYIYYQPNVLKLISIYKLKPKFQRLLAPVLKAMHQAGISPNAITWIAIALSLATGLLFYLRPYGSTFLVISLALLLRMALNALDGMMAKTYNLQSKKGELLNEMGDVVSDLFIFFPFYFLPQVNSFVVLGFLFLSIINEFAGVLAKVISGERRYDGPMGKSDRALFIGIVCIILYIYPSFANYLSICFSIASLLLLISTCVRLIRSLKTTT